MNVTVEQTGQSGAPVVSLTNRTLLLEVKLRDIVNSHFSGTALLIETYLNLRPIRQGTSF